jgi:hypothetical protein
MNEIVLELRTEQGALAIEALAELPFKAVYELIGRLNQQANAGAPGAGSGSARYRLCEADLELLLGALAQLPYYRVHRLLAELQQQASGQMAERA